MLQSDISLLFFKKFVELNDSDLNEPFVMEVINKSSYHLSKYIPFELVLDQSNSQPDFKSKNNYILDLKMFVPSEFWRNIKKNGQSYIFNELPRFYNYFNNFQEVPEFYKCEKDLKIENDILKLENSLKRALKKNKNLVVFIPFPTMKSKDSYFNMPNSLDHWFYDLSSNFENDIFILEITYDGTFALTNAKTYLSEFIDFNFNNYMIAGIKNTKIVNI